MNALTFPLSLRVAVTDAVIRSCVKPECRKQDAGTVTPLAVAAYNALQSMAGFEDWPAPRVQEWRDVLYLWTDSRGRGYTKAIPPALAIASIPPCVLPYIEIWDEKGVWRSADNLTLTLDFRALTAQERKSWLPFRQRLIKEGEAMEAAAAKFEARFPSPEPATFTLTAGGYSLSGKDDE